MEALTANHFKGKSLLGNAKSNGDDCSSLSCWSELLAIWTDPHCWHLLAVVNCTGLGFGGSTFPVA